MQITGICCVYFKSKPKHESIYFFFVQLKIEIEEEIVLCKDLFLLYVLERKYFLTMVVNKKLNQKKIPHLM